MTNWPPFIFLTILAGTGLNVGDSMSPSAGHPDDWFDLEMTFCRKEDHEKGPSGWLDTAKGHGVTGGVDGWPGGGCKGNDPMEDDVGIVDQGQ